MILNGPTRSRWYPIKSSTNGLMLPLSSASPRIPARNFFFESGATDETKSLTCSDHWTSALIGNFGISHVSGPICLNQRHQLAVLLQFHGFQDALHHLAGDQERDSLAVSGDAPYAKGFGVSDGAGD